MSKYRISLEGKTYEMDVELIGEGGAVKPVAKAAAASAPAQPAVSAPVAAPAAPAQQANQEVSSGSVVAPMPGTVIKIVKNVGDEVKAGELVLILEAMKMENEISAPVSGKIAAINCTAGGTVNGGDVLFEVK
ncbi:MAG: biotin/lipoyl-binding protein [Saccharofermentans sp.]|nr:biotin/lipoyl-binding protein [Saccharofermentans sp.]